MFSVRFYLLSTGNYSPPWSLSTRVINIPRASIAGFILLACCSVIFPQQTPFVISVTVFVAPQIISTTWASAALRASPIFPILTNIGCKSFLKTSTLLALLDKLWEKDTHFRKELRQLKRKIYLMDASIIPLCLSVFDWAKFRSTKGAVKLHTVLDYDGCLPVFMQITDGKVHESQRANSYSLAKGSVVVVDRGYVDYNWLGDLDSMGCFFVTRSKTNMKYTVVKSYQSEILSANGILKDELIELCGSAGEKYKGRSRSSSSTLNNG